MLDLYCKAGGASRGYADAGFRMIGVDIEPQPNYPYRFIQADVADLSVADVMAMDVMAIHASPPCKVHTALKHFSGAQHTDLIPSARKLLKAAGLPYVIENVPGAPLLDPVTLCGSTFGLGVRRHRLFETSFPLHQPRCDHAGQDAGSPMYPVKRYHSGRPVIVPSPIIGVFGRGQGLGTGETDLWKQAMGIDWMTRDEMAQAIPPIYAAYIAGFIPTP